MKKAKLKDWSYTGTDWAITYIHIHTQHQHRDTHLLIEWQCFHGESAGVTSSPPCVVRVTMEMLCSDGVCARAYMYICYIIWKHTTCGLFGLFKSFFFWYDNDKRFRGSILSCVSICVCMCVRVCPSWTGSRSPQHLGPCVTCCGLTPWKTLAMRRPRNTLGTTQSEAAPISTGQVADRTDTQLPGRWSHLKTEHRQYHLRD